MSQPDHVLIEISPGEFYDRYSILQLKLERVRDRAKRAVAAKHMAMLQGASPALLYRYYANAEFAKRVDELYITNRALWDTEEQIRAIDQQVFDGMKLREEIPKDVLPSYLYLARQVYYFNDKRSKLKAAIDADYGIAPEVKEYHDQEVKAVDGT